MNLLLVEPGEVAPDDTVTLADRRAAHLRAVLGVTAGQVVRAGVVGGPLRPATVVADDGAALTVALGPPSPARAPLPVDLVLAVPRPKVLSRALEIAASFGVGRVALTNAWRVDKSYLRSPRTAPAALAHAARLGAEQGGTTHVPPVTVHPRLMGLLDERFPPIPPAPPAPAPPPRPPGTHLLFHPDAPTLHAIPLTAPLTLAIGPEGGWIAREVDTFVARGFTPVSLGPPILRTEAALAAALGQLLLLLPPDSQA